IYRDRLRVRHRSGGVDRPAWSRTGEVVREKEDMKRLLLGLLMVGLAACGDNSATGKKKYRFALIPKMLSNDVFNYGRIGAEKTAAEIAAKENVEIEIVWQAPAQSNPAQQASIVETLADQKVSGISVSVDEANTLKKA